jgi:hypothetical protein
MKYKDAKTQGEANTKYNVIRGWWPSSRAAIEEGMYGLSDWLGFRHLYYRQQGRNMLLVNS